MFPSVTLIVKGATVNGMVVGLVAGQPAWRADGGWSGCAAAAGFSVRTSAPGPLAVKVS